MRLDELVSSSDVPKNAAERVVQSVRTTLDGAFSGVNASVDHLRTQSLPTEEELATSLQRLEVAEQLQVALRPRFDVFNFRLEPNITPHPYGGNYNYTVLRRNGTEVALVQIPSIVFYYDKKTPPPFAPHFGHLLKAFRGKLTRLFSEGVAGLIYNFEAALTDERKDQDWSLVPWPDIETFQEGTLDVWQVFKLAKPADTVALPGVRSLDDAQIGIVITIVSRLAGDNPAGAEAQFKGWVQESNWPEAWKNARKAGWGPDCTLNARALVDYARNRGTFPATHTLAGQSVIGELLRMILESNLAGGDDADALAHIIVSCRLLRSDADLTRIKETYY